jgi:hypothetical protein
MKVIRIADTEVELYSSIKELPIAVSKKLHLFLLQESGIGNTIQAIDDRLQKLMLFVSNDEKGPALEEAKNLRFALFSTVSEMDYQSASFGCLIKSVNGKQTNDYTQEGLQKLVGELSEKGLTSGEIAETLDEVKKNLILSEDFISLESFQTI